jgi:signal transduction histidine kinase
MKRWHHDSIATTIALTIVVAVLLGLALQQAVNVGLQYVGFSPQQSGQDESTRFFFVLLPGKVAGLLDVLETRPNAERPAIVKAAQHPLARFELLDGPVPNMVNAGEPNAEALRRRIEVLLSIPHLVVAASRPRQVNQPADGVVGRGQDAMLVEVALSDGHWLLCTMSAYVPPFFNPAAVDFSRASLEASLALSALLLVLLSVLAARRLAKPLSELATAVEQLGGSGDESPLPSRGPRELRVTIDAFNRMQERLRRFNDDRTQMLAAMSHDLRTPLTRLRLRLESVEDPEQQQKMLTELDAMSAMIESILSFARDDAKREPRTLVDLGALVEGVCEDASDAGGTVTFSGARGIAISGRPAALRRAISNLVDNAVKYGGGATVSLISEAGRVVITIEDEGAGIPRSEREQVFEPFYRIEGSRNPDTGGVGLGLSVARSIAREHGGDITLANRKGGGLSVRFELPA